jgi:CelD/BcsL family acetyltransferase involved in cellulose biosynthesis
MAIERISDEAGFAALRDEWRALLEECDADTIFLSWEWLHTWWQHVGSHLRLAIWTVRKGGSLQALAPMVAKGWELGRLRPFRTLGLLGAPLRSGNVGSDYLDLIVSRRSPEAGRELAAALAQEGRVLELAQVGGVGSAAERILAEEPYKGWSHRRHESGVCPIADLAGHTWDSYLASRGRGHREGIRRKLRAVRKNFNVRFERADSEAQRAEFLSILMDLHERRFRKKGSSDAFHTKALRAFHETFSRLALERHWLRLFVLRLNGAPAAALYGLRYGPDFLFYQSGLDPAYAEHGVGVVTMALSIEAAIAEGASRYDLLHGNEEYKFHWANRTRSLVKWLLFPPRPQGLWPEAFSALRAAVAPMARRVLPLH